MTFLKSFSRQSRKAPQASNADDSGTSVINLESKFKPNEGKIKIPDRQSSQETLETLDPNALAFKTKLKDQGQAAVAALLKEFLDTERSWEVWHNKKGVKVEKTDQCLSGSISGRGRTSWEPPTDAYNMEYILDFMWDDKTKPLYDEATEAMILLLEVDADCHVVDQVFKGRYGFSGRDFVVVVHKALIVDDKYERAVFAAQSLEEEDVQTVLELCEHPDNKEAYLASSSKLVRGHAFIAGIVIEREIATNLYTVAYVNDADLKTKGVPKWVVDRVKVDQLKIVENIPPCINKSWQEKNH